MKMQSNEIQELFLAKKEVLGKDKHNFSLYFHMPFCLGKCSFCVYHSNDLYELDNPKESMKEYLDTLIKQIEDWKSTLEELPQITSVYFGGGTASLIPESYLRKIACLIPNWDKIESKIFEANPTSLTKYKVDYLKELGFTYITLGLQTFNEDYLDEVNRRNLTKEKTIELVKYINKKGIILNIDLLTFMRDNSIEYKDYKNSLEILKGDIITLMKNGVPSIDVNHKYSFHDKIQGLPIEKGVLRELNNMYDEIGLFYNDDLGYDVPAGDLNNIIMNVYITKDYDISRKKYNSTGLVNLNLEERVNFKDNSIITFGGAVDNKTYGYIQGGIDSLYFTYIEDKEVFYE